eukprot:365661-Chlamydomonas_euryale.AAC.48
MCADPLLVLVCVRVLDVPRDCHDAAYYSLAPHSITIADFTVCCQKFEGVRASAESLLIKLTRTNRTGRQERPTPLAKRGL